MEKLYVIKIGGNVIDNESVLDKFLFDFARIKGKKILIHGGGKIATEMGKKLGLETKMVEGRRITDKAMLDIVTMVYAGLINKQIVAKLQKNNCVAIGLSGADANIIPAKRRGITNGIDYGFVGDIPATAIKYESFIPFLSSSLTPIICPITSEIITDENGVDKSTGSLLNTNADTIATRIALALHYKYSVSLIFCFEQRGVMTDLNDANSLISIISLKDNYLDIINSKIISGGMIPKIQNAASAVDAGVNEVIICNSNDLLKITEGETLGTTICK